MTQEKKDEKTMLYRPATEVKIERLGNGWTIRYTKRATPSFIRMNKDIYLYCEGMPSLTKALEQSQEAEYKDKETDL